MNPVRSTALSTLLIGLAFGIAGCGGAARQTAPAVVDDGPAHAAKIPAGAARGLKDTPFERSWDLDLKKPVTGSWVVPELPDVVLFQLAGGNEIVAVDAMSGHTRWVTPALPEALRMPPSAVRTRLPGDRTREALYDERLYLIAQDTLFCIDGASGQLIWRYELPFSPSSAPRPVGVDNGLRVFVGDWSGRLQATSFQLDKAFPYVAWQVNLGSPVVSQPVEAEELVYIADGAGVVHAFKLDREQVWSFAAGGHLDGSPVMRDRVLFVGTSDSIVFALNRLTGEKLGQVNLNAPVTRAPFVFRGDPDRVYAWVSLDQGDRGGLYAIDAKNDTVPFTDAARHPLEVVRMGQGWHVAGVDTLVGSTPGYLYATAGAGSVVKAIDRRTGTVSWTWDVAAEREAEQLAAGVRHGDTARFERLVSYQDPTDLNRSFFAIDQRGGVVAYRFFGYVPGDKAAEEVPAAAPPKKAKDAAQAADAAAVPAAVPAAAAPGEEAKPATAPAPTAAPAQ